MSSKGALCTRPSAARRARARHNRCSARRFGSMRILFLRCRDTLQPRLIQVHNGWLPFEQQPTALIEAEKAIERLIKLDPGNAAGHYLRASLLRARGAPDKAIASLTYALSLNPNFFAAHAELGRIKIDAGRAHELIAHIREALELSPPETNMHVLYFWMGLAALHTADDEAAVQWLLKALQINPRFAPSHLHLAAAYLGVEDETKARASMAEFRKEVPNPSNSLRCSAGAKSNTGCRPAAQADARCLASTRNS